MSIWSEYVSMQQLLCLKCYHPTTRIKSINNKLSTWQTLVNALHVCVCVCIGWLPSKSKTSQVCVRVCVWPARPFISGGGFSMTNLCRIITLSFFLRHITKIKTRDVIKHLVISKPNSSLQQINKMWLSEPLFLPLSSIHAYFLL